MIRMDLNITATHCRMVRDEKTFGWWRWFYAQLITGMIHLHVYGRLAGWKIEKIGWMNTHTHTSQLVDTSSFARFWRTPKQVSIVNTLSIVWFLISFFLIFFHLIIFKKYHSRGGSSGKRLPIIIVLYAISSRFCIRDFWTELQCDGFVSPSLSLSLSLSASHNRLMTLPHHCNELIPPELFEPQ